VICPVCGAENRSGARFCDVCGAALPSDAVREVRKVVTVLFCDVTGSTALGEQLDPEALRAVMARYFTAARAAVERHGGTVEKFIGDAVMAVFGIPTVREDDALRAVRAAVELRDAAELDVRIGVNTGEVVTGSGETLVTGDAVNVAARLEQAAGSGEILIGAETHRLVRDAVDVQEIAPIAAKGKSESLIAYRLNAVTGDVAYVRRFDAPLVGRDRERRLLGDAWERCRSEDACALFTVLGNAGVGKSRLAAEFLASLDATVVTGRCLSYGEGITYWPVVEVAKQLLGDDPPPDAAVAALLGDGNVPTDEIAVAVRRLFEARARERPLVVAFDDVQWAEPTFLDLIEHVADWSRGAPLLLLCLARPDLLDLRAGWGGGKLNATTVLLEPLSDDETDELIERLLGAAELGDGLRSRIHAAAEGNPLFVEQMLAVVQDSPDGEVSVPPTIQALLAARLDQLPGGERAALERGAVEGQVFHRGAVQALAPEEPAAPALLGLVRKELVRPTAPTLPDDDAFRFRHLLIRDAAYESLPKAQRAVLHERFADWLELNGAALVELDEILGYHLEQAALYRAELGEAADELARRAAARLTTAGRRAVRRADFSACRNLLGRAVAVLPDDAPERFVALPWLGISEYVGGDLARADAILTEAVEHGELEESTIAFFLRAGARGHTTGEPLEDVEAEVRLRLQTFGPQLSDHALAQGHLVLCRVLFWRGRTDEVVVTGRKAIEHARRADETVVEALATHMVGAGMGYGSTRWLEFEAFARSILADRARLGRLAADAETGLSAAAAYQGRFGEARDLLNARVADADEHGDTFGVINARQDIGWLHYLAGDLAGAELELRACWDELGELGERGFRSTSGAMLAVMLAKLGRVAEAGEITAEAAAMASDDDFLTHATAEVARASIAAAKGDPGEAVRRSHRAVEIADGSQYVLLRPWFWLELGEHLLAVNRPDEARQALEEAIRLARIKGSTVFEDRGRALLSGGEIG